MGSYRGIVGRDPELAVLSDTITGAVAGRGGMVLVEGPAGIGKTTLLRAACTGGDGRMLTARGLALEGGFPYGIVRQLLEPVRAAAGPGEWDGLLEGAAGLAARVFDGAEPGAVEDDVPHAVQHGLYWLVANLAARGPLVIAVDDAHWADVPSLRWLAHLAARIEGLPVALLLAVRDGPAEPPVVPELRACPACTPLRLGPLTAQAAAALVRQWLGAQADDQLCQTCHARTGGNPFLLEALATALGAPGDADLLARVDRLGPESVARAVLRRVVQLGDGADQLTRALAVLGGPAPARLAAALAGQDAAAAARLADRLRAGDVLGPGSVLEFAHPIVRTAVYDSIPPGERALAHAEAARLLERDGADPERIALHLLRSEPAGDARVVTLLRAAAAAASGRGAPGPAADYLRRALDEPPEPTARRGNPARPGSGAGPGTQPGRPGRAAGRGPADRDPAGARDDRAAGRPGPRDLGPPRKRRAHLPRCARPPSGRRRGDRQPGGRAFREHLDRHGDRGRGQDAGAGPSGLPARLRCLARPCRLVGDGGAAER